MKFKLLFTALSLALNLTAYGQNISFESAEGYTLGEINNQQGWIYYGTTTPNTATIINTTSTLGTNSANVFGNKQF